MHPDTRPQRGHRPRTPADLLVDEQGAEQMDYLLVFAAIVVPLVVAARLLWVVLLHYFAVEAFVVDLPLF
jgi:hypothetical protein